MIKRPTLNNDYLSESIDEHGQSLDQRLLAGSRREDARVGSPVTDMETTPPVPADRRLSEQIDQALRATGYLSLRDFSVTAADRVVTLKGRVPSYYLKQVVHSAVRDLPGVTQVRDEIEVYVSR
jgi:osmotically-inducible protein OsmY